MGAPEGWASFRCVHHGVLPTDSTGFGGSGSGGSGFGGSPSPRGGAGGRGRRVDQGAARLALEKAQERKALELFHQNRLVESEREYRQLIAAGSRNPEVYLNLAAIFWLTGRTEAAVEPLHTAIALDPANPEAHATLSTALQASGDLAGAVAAHRRALELRPEFVEAMVSLGNALIAACDEVVSVSNVTAHLAGAIEARSRILVSQGDRNDRRWPAHTDFTLWHPNAKLIHQQQYNRWGSELETLMS